MRFSIIILLALSLWVQGQFVDRTDYLPFSKPSTAALRNSSKKVFAHYFSQFPVSIDNADSASDYYTTQYLNPLGENGKHKNYGGYLRERPLFRPVRPEANWPILDMESEIRLAINLGLDGFIFDIMSTTNYHWDRLNNLFLAATTVDTGFKILLMPDMTALTTKEEVIACVTTFKDNPCVFKHNGKIVLSPYCAHIQTVDWWKSVLDSLDKQNINIAFVPLFQGFWNYAASFAPISEGMSDWGDASYDVVLQYWQTVPSQAHAILPIWMMPVRPQDFRPKDFHYYEAVNSSLFRESWKIAIEDGADWVQLITWSDYSEHSEIMASSGIQYSFADLTTYYTSWFKTGIQPDITKDVLYYFHRIEPTSAKYNTTQQTQPFGCVAPGTPSNQIELLAFLTAPGKLEITVNGKTDSLTAPAGITSFKVPMDTGRPIFRLIRDGKTIVSEASPFTIRDSVLYQDLLYRGGSTLPVTPPTHTNGPAVAIGPKLIKMSQNQNRATISFSNDQSILGIRLYNIKGQLQEELTGSMSHLQVVNTQNLATGLYLLKLVTKSGVYHCKLPVCH